MNEEGGENGELGDRLAKFVAMPVCSSFIRTKRMLVIDCDPDARLGAVWLNLAKYLCRRCHETLAIFSAIARPTRRSIFVSLPLAPSIAHTFSRFTIHLEYTVGELAFWARWLSLAVNFKS